MNRGDLVRLVRLTSWGGLIPTDRVGVILNLSYVAYDDTLSKWKVLMCGHVHTLQARQLMPLNNSQRVI